MKIYSILFVLLCFIMTSFFSEKSIFIRYEERIEIHDFAGVDDNIKLRIQKAMSEKYSVRDLVQVGNKSCFQLAKKEFQPLVSVDVQSYDDEDYYWKDFSNNQLELLKYTNNAQYSVKDKLPTVDWELDFDAQRILGYNCNSAFAKNDCLLGTTFDTIKVWFTTEIPISNGPYLFHGLPGMILKIEMSNWQVKRTIVAKEITLNKTAEIVIPTIKADKEVSFDELCQIKNESQKKLRKRVKFNKNKK